MNDQAAEIERLKIAVRIRAERAAADAIGKDFRVKVGPNEFYNGTITSCTVATVTRQRNVVKAQFRVTIGTNRPILVSRLPQTTTK